MADDVRDDRGLPPIDRLLSMIVENITDVVTFSTPDRLTAWISPSVRDVLGYEPEQLIGQPLADLIHPDDLHLVALARELVAEGYATSSRASPWTVRMRHADGSYRFLSGRAVPVTDASGQLLGIATSQRDVTDLVAARDEAESALARVSAIIENLGQPCVVCDPLFDGEQVVDLRYLEVNRAACETLRHTREQMVGGTMSELFPGQYRLMVDNFSPTVIDGTPRVLENLFSDRDGGGFFDAVGSRSDDMLVITWRNVTDRKRREDLLAENAEVYRLVADDMWDAVVRTDATARITWMSPSFTTLSGIGTEALGTPASDVFVHPDDPATTWDLDSLVGGEREDQLWHMLHHDGPRTWVRVRWTAIPDEHGEPAGLVAAIRDVDDEVRARRALQDSIGRDELTGLDTWAATLGHLRRVLGEDETVPPIGHDHGPGRRSRPPARSHAGVALFCIGVDRLRSVNEGLSHRAGDELLATVARRLVAAVGDRGQVGRIAGDEFSLILPGVTARGDLAEVATRLVAAAGQEVALLGHLLAPSVSIGIAVIAPGQHGHAETLLRDATLAMHRTKAMRRGGWSFADPELSQAAGVRLHQEVALREALVTGDVVAWYQPIVDLATGRPVGAEALVRWKHEGNIRPPAEFLDVAETSGLIVDIDWTVLRQTLDQMDPEADGNGLGRIRSVNMSAVTLTADEFAERFADLYGRYELMPGQLHLEITETMLLRVSDQLADMMERLAETGVRWYVDDFGTGYSSLSHLRDLRIHGLKLDRSFTQDLTRDDSDSFRLARGLAGLAGGVGLDTVAEGVETPEQARILAAQGWEKGQGYLFGRPAPLPAPRSAPAGTEVG